MINKKVSHYLYDFKKKFLLLPISNFSKQIAISTFLSLTKNILRIFLEKEIECNICIINSIQNFQHWNYSLEL